MDFKYIFVILVYRNTEDIRECLNSIEKKFKNYKIIIVNGYFDEKTTVIFNEIAVEYDCDFINVPNKGYGAGNNRGIEYAIKKYKFKYLIISNPDIIVRKFDETIFNEQSQQYDVIAPIIKNKNGKNQNPYWATENFVAERLIYEGEKYKSIFLLYSGYLIHKVIRTCMLYTFLRSKYNGIDIFAAHGSFFIMSSRVLNEITPIYDENMFLFAEEAYLAHRLKEKKIRIVLSKAIEIYHKEDGSMKFSKINQFDEERKSVVYYYEKYVKR